MNCNDFQKSLPDFMESGEGAEESAHLHSCAVCSGLVQDLKYIAEAARMLVPMEDPSPHVWENIQRSLEREGVVRPVRGTVRLEPFLIPTPRRGNFYGWAGIAAVALVTLSILAYQRLQSPVNLQKDTAVAGEAPTAIDTADISISADDKQLLSAITHKSPSMGVSYKKRMSSVENYIKEARGSVKLDPGDAIARQQLMNAYQQRDSLHEMAVSYTTR
jgi:hypothetical protein